MSIKSFYDKVPQLVKSFLLRATLIFTGWQLLYRLLLDGLRIPDRFLTNITCYSTAKIMEVFYSNVNTFYTHTNEVRSAVITVNRHRVIAIADPCNGLEIYVLYISFLYCFPGMWKRRLLFIALGLPYIYIINSIRCVLIAWLNMSHKGWSDFSHHYVFTTAVYLMVFYLWVQYSKKGILNAK